MRRESGMKAVEKRELALCSKIFEGYLDNLPRRLQRPVIDGCQLRPYRKGRVEALGNGVARGSPVRTSVSSL